MYVVTSICYRDYMEVGIRELKARLSLYVGEAADGATIVITDRGKPVARLTAINETSHFERGIDEGWIEPARRTRLGVAHPVLAKESIMSVLDEDRG